VDIFVLEEPSVPWTERKAYPRASGGSVAAFAHSAQTLRLTKIQTEDDPTTIVEFAFAERQLDEKIGKRGTQQATQKGNS
jgi:hypothetical protein